ncbi:hypothetical protein [Abyssibacter sp.]|uniref:hypothetical protein n=1 Tax=Abyssibacter sp. TaxID=2320200 RepID=UPI0025C0E8A7|nr:hypothetical protein [Abyssibacter sp.]
MVTSARICSRRFVSTLFLLVALVTPVHAFPGGASALVASAGGGWKTGAVRQAMAEIQSRYGGSMIRQQSSGDTLLVQWRTRQGVQVFVIEPSTGRWYPAPRRDARPGR